jgi:ribonuclease-3
MTLNQLQQDLGYSFSNDLILKEALTHSSYASEKVLDYDNQRLEFLGDAVIELVVTDYLFNKFKEKSEGEFTAIRSSIVQRATLAKAARIITLQNYIFLGKGEKESDGSNRDSTLCDAFEAIMGAIYLDGGLEEVKRVFLKITEGIIEELSTAAFNLNPKGLLQEMLQKERGIKPVYVLKDVIGPQHIPVFTVELYIGKEKVSEGKGSNKKQAEVEAAIVALNLHYKKDEEVITD